MNKAFLIVTLLGIFANLHSCLVCVEELTIKGRTLTPLMNAIIDGNDEKFISLLEIDADIKINQQDASGDTALHWAVAMSNEKYVEKLLNRDDINIHIKNNDGLTAFQRAKLEGTENIVELFNGKSMIKSVPILTPPDKKLTSAIIKTLIEHGVNTSAYDLSAFNERNARGLLLIHHLKNNDPLQARKLLNTRLNINITDENKMTALMIAASRGYSDIVGILLIGTLNINAQDSAGLTALHAAAYQGQIDSVKLLLDAGAKKNIVNNMGQKPYCLAMKNNHNKIAALLKKLR